jgi:TPR repeat protein
MVQEGRCSVSAMNNLGLLYQNGRGVTQDYAKAREWFEKAANKGDADARARLEQLRDKLQPDQMRPIVRRHDYSTGST